MQVVRKISLVMGSAELKSAIQSWISQTDMDIAEHLAKNSCNFVINEGEDGFTITLDIAGEFVESVKEMADVKILVCGMSRSGSTLLTKVLVKYFEIYHFKNMKVFPGKYFYNADRQRRNFVGKQKNYIAKLHLRSERIKLAEPRPAFINKFDLFFCTKRDIRDSLSSELISLNFRDSLAPLNSSTSVRIDEIKRISKVLYLEHTLWHQNLSKHLLGKKVFDWKYESYKQDPIAQFENVFSYIKEMCPFVDVPTRSQIQELLDAVEEPISLTPELHRCSVGMSKFRNRASTIGTSSTGGKVGYYKKFLIRKHLDCVNEEHRAWIEENGYDIE